ncbi:MAG: adenosylcobinamide-GDP ribazoletransferase [Chloroflexi bacterium]|nr:adenosylcobinamide-GDP ribazoletransferase [Chloroflexota bacterium]
MDSLRHAFGFLTILPVTSPGEAPSAASRAWFPIVGLALGALLVGLDALLRLGLPTIVVGALLLAATLIVTRALHTEGFLDCCDGLFGAYTPEARLKILRDTHVGAFAVIGGAVLLILKFGLLASLPDGARIGLLLVFPCLSRMGMLLTMSLFPYARRAGAGTTLQEGASRWQVMIGLATAALASGLFLGPGGFILFGMVIVAALGMGLWISSLLGGMTGDAYGAVNELGEVVVLVSGIALVSALASLFETPFW